MCPKSPIIHAIIPEGILLEIIECNISRTSLDDFRYYQRPLTNGYSIGESGNTRSGGTFGGLLKDKNTGIIYGISCGHALKTLHGQVVQPSDSDHQQRLDDINNSLSENPNDQDYLILKLQCEGNDRTIGTVVRRELTEVPFSNELPMVHEYWALIEIAVEGENKNYHRRAGVPGPIKRISNVDTEHDPLIKVTKHGMATYITTGKLNGIKSIVRFDDTTPGVFASEYAVIGEGGNSFAEAGDSGSWVVTESGELIGMVLGGGVRQGYVTIISCMNFLLRRIQQRTGIELELP